LIEAVAVSGCTFERNGNQYDAKSAADHLRMKYRRGKRYANTSENFIDRLASRSSITRKPYFIICADSDKQTASDWLYAALAIIRT